jgi:hypothetical protein
VKGKCAAGRTTSPIIEFYVILIVSVRQQARDKDLKRGDVVSKRAFPYKNFTPDRLRTTPPDDGRV